MTKKKNLRLFNKIAKRLLFIAPTFAFVGCSWLIGEPKLPEKLKNH